MDPNEIDVVLAKRFLEVLVGHDHEYYDETCWDDPMSDLFLTPIFLVSRTLGLNEQHLKSALRRSYSKDDEYRTDEAERKVATWDSGRNIDAIIFFLKSKRRPASADEIIDELLSRGKITFNCEEPDCHRSHSLILSREPLEIALRKAICDCPDCIHKQVIFFDETTNEYHYRPPKRRMKRPKILISAKEKKKRRKAKKRDRKRPRRWNPAH